MGVCGKTGRKLAQYAIIADQPCMCRLVHCDAELAEQASALAPTGMDHLAQAQYNAARIIRHLALDKDAAHRMAAHAAVPTLVSLMRVSRARV